jgi:sugar/nucleoside kinase (ribokinase family)
MLPVPAPRAIGEHDLCHQNNGLIVGCNRLPVGVDTTYVDTVKGPSGIALITTGLEGENSIVVVLGASSQLTPTLLEKTLPILHHAGFILVQLEIPVETVEFQIRH